MQNVRSTYTDSICFFGKTSPHELIETYGSPLYVYNEKILRQRCKELISLSSYPGFFVNYSVKANSNPHLLSIIKDEGCIVDAMSPGELYINQQAGFTSDQILYVCNNVSSNELQNAIDNNILISLDSLSQLESYGKINPYSEVMIRINPGKGAGHNKKVITAGNETKFGINPEEIDNVKKLLKQYHLTIIGINQHIGSLFLDSEVYLSSSNFLLQLIEKNIDILSQIEIINLGGGFGIPYKKYEDQPALNIKELSEKLHTLITTWSKKTAYEGRFYIEPGRYLVAESGLLLGTVHATKNNGDIRYVGTDIGFNVLMRPVLYNSHHDIEVYRKNGSPELKLIPQTVVGNICESGDILASQRPLPLICKDDIIGVLDAGAYGFSMSSNYNNRLKPAEVLIQTNGTHTCIRKREELEHLIQGT